MVKTEIKGKTEFELIENMIKWFWELKEAERRHDDSMRIMALEILYKAACNEFIWTKCSPEFREKYL